MLERMWRTGNPLTLLVGMQVGITTLENSVEVPQKVKNIATLWPSNYTTAYLTQGYWCSDLKGHLHPNVHRSNVHNSQTVEGAEMPFNRQMDKEDVVHIFNGILFSHQKGWIPTISIYINGTGGDYTKWRTSSKERQLPYDFTYTWNMRNSMEEIRRRKGKMKQGKSEGEKNHERLWTMGNKLRVSEGRGCGNGLARWWVLRRTCIAWSPGYYMQKMNHGKLHKKLRMYCMVTNIK